MSQAFLGLGGNLGDPASAMAVALRHLATQESITVRSVSRLFQTPPWGYTDQPAFLNAAAALDTSLAATDLLELCLDTERMLKRERRERWGPRTIDIDILVFGDERSRSDTLTLPHPRLTERAFALMPLEDVAPDLMVDGRSVADWVSGIACEGIEPLGETRDWWLRL